MQMWPGCHFCLGKPWSCIDSLFGGASYHCWNRTERTSWIHVRNSVSFSFMDYDPHPPLTSNGLTYLRARQVALTSSCLQPSPSKWCANMLWVECLSPMLRALEASTPGSCLTLTWSKPTEGWKHYKEKQRQVMERNKDTRYHWKQ